MHIGIDIDGVILDFEKTMRTYAELYDLFWLNKDGVSFPNQFSYLKRYNWTEKETEKFINDFLIHGTAQTPFLACCLPCLQILKSLNFKTSIITARGSLKKETVNVVNSIFEQNDVFVDNIYWSIVDKVKCCKESNVDIMVEDNPDICLMLAKNGIKTIYMMSNDTNVSINHPNIMVAHNWGEICRILLPYSSQSPDFEQIKKILVANN